MNKTKTETAAYARTEPVCGADGEEAPQTQTDRTKFARQSVSLLVNHLHFCYGCCCVILFTHINLEKHTNKVLNSNRT